ncbi:MAG: hypothetical protein JOZ81_24965 [Chloroflexi bacterium]|nr:hypothetical protein [Chloroflexota bacterium]
MEDDERRAKHTDDDGQGAQASSGAPDGRAPTTGIAGGQSLGGESIRFVVPHLDAADEARIIQGFNEQRTSEYAEIIEECETKFQKEIEFEHFRQNYTFEEAEEIQQDLDKIRRWYERVRERDWFGAARADEVERWLDKCQELLNGFTEEVHRRSQDGPTAALGDADGSSELAVDSGSELPPVVSPLPLGRRKRPSQSNGGA